jgi:hypothetical protein
LYDLTVPPSNERLPPLYDLTLSTEREEPLNDLFWPPEPLHDLPVPATVLLSRRVITPPL